MVQVYLVADKTTVTYAEAKQAVSRAYQWFSEPSLLDQHNNLLVFLSSTPTIQLELVVLLPGHRIP